MCEIAENRLECRRFIHCLSSPSSWVLKLTHTLHSTNSLFLTESFYLRLIFSATITDTTAVSTTLALYLIISSQCVDVHKYAKFYVVYECVEALLNLKMSLDSVTRKVFWQFLSQQRIWKTCQIIKGSLLVSRWILIIIDWLMSEACCEMLFWLVVFISIH